ncbi:MAG: hypothetical protein RLZZ179_1763 [Verrucomicrobiota bacterium]|jgi:uncharacterized protein (DUF58 family)
MLTDPSFIRKLDGLYLLARKVLGGSMQADRKSTKKGSGITFADYAEYHPGDDFRSIDWRVYGRFEQLVVKLFEIDEDATVYILLDESPSMKSKFLTARQLAAGIGYIALHMLDQLCVYGLADRLQPILERTRGRGKVLPFLRGLEDATTFGSDTNFTACAREFQARHRRKGIIVVISDFLFPSGFDDGLKFLQWNRHEVFCLQVQDENDTKCDWKGDVELTCVETGQRQRLTITPREAKLYEQAVADWNESLRKCCAKRGIGLASTTPRVPFEVVITDILRRGGLVA